MTTPDLDRYLQAIDGDQPSGPDLEHDSEFISLEQRLEGTPERQIGDVLEAARPPPWPEVAGSIESLLLRTHDLRLAVYLTRCKLHYEGFLGLRVGLALIRSLLQTFWSSVHPQLDLDDDLDPTYRLNILRGLSDHGSLLVPIANSPILSSRTLGHFTLSQLRRLNAGSAPAEGEPLVDETHVRAICLDNPTEDVSAVFESLQASLKELLEIDQILDKELGSQNTLDLDPLRSSLKEISQFLAPFAEDSTNTGASDTDESPASEMRSTDNAPTRSNGPISSRADVIRALDQIADYYQKHEPSSPVPLFIKRARSMVDKDFLEIIRDMAPDGVHQIETLAGLGSRGD